VITAELHAISDKWRPTIIEYPFIGIEKELFPPVVSKPAVPAPLGNVRVFHPLGVLVGHVTEEPPFW
jgi:hypothetical protein